MRLLEDSDLLDKGHHLTVDNFFSSPTLFQELFERDTTATGTVRVNRRGLPRPAIEAHLLNQESAERRKGPLLCVIYQDGTRRVILLTTEAQPGRNMVTNRQGEDRDKPNVVVLYNSTMGGVDLMDSKLYMYLGERKTIKWTTKLFLNLVGRSLLNAFIIYEKNANARRKLNRHEFMVATVEALTAHYRPRRTIHRRRSNAEIAAARAAPAAPPLPSPWSILEGHELVRVRPGTRRNCVGRHDKRTRTRWMCRACNLGVCPACFTSLHLR
jgi:hypothetical protein